MSQVSTFFDEDFSSKSNQRIRCLSLFEAQQEVDTMASEGFGSLQDISQRAVLHTSGFDILLPGKSKITLAVLHGLIFNPFYEVIVKCYCHAVRAVLEMDGYDHLKGTHFELLFPSKLQRPSPFGGFDYRLLELHSEPIILIYPSGNTSFASLDLYVPKGIYRHHYYFSVMPIIKLGKKELVAESNLVVTKAKSFIAHRLLSIFTLRQIDVLELLAKGKKSKDIAAILSKIGKGEEVTKSTIDTHRRDINKRIKDLFPGCNDMAMAMILKELGCL